MVKIGDFDHWCIEASELVDVVIDLIWRDEKYLHRDGLSTRDESLRRISNLNSQFVNFVCFSVFELARKRLSPPSRTSRCASTNKLVLTPATPRNNNLLLRDSPNCAELTSFFVSTATSRNYHHHHCLAPTPCDDTPERGGEEGEEEEGEEEREERRKAPTGGKAGPTTKAEHECTRG